MATTGRRPRGATPGVPGPTDGGAPARALPCWDAGGDRCGQQQVAGSARRPPEAAAAPAALNSGFGEAVQAAAANVSGSASLRHARALDVRASPARRRPRRAVPSPSIAPWWAASTTVRAIRRVSATRSNGSLIAVRAVRRPVRSVGVRGGCRDRLRSRPRTRGAGVPSQVPAAVRRPSRVQRTGEAGAGQHDAPRDDRVAVQAHDLASPADRRVRRRAAWPLSRCEHGRHLRCRA